MSIIAQGASRNNTIFKVGPEFRDKIPPLTGAEFEQLKENILSAGEVVQLKFGDLIVPHPPQGFKENDVKSGGNNAVH